MRIIMGAENCPEISKDFLKCPFSLLFFFLVLNECSISFKGVLQ